MSSSHWEEFYANHLPPSDFEDNRTLLKEFCDRHNEDQASIVLVTVRISLKYSLLLYSTCKADRKISTIYYVSIK